MTTSIRTPSVHTPGPLRKRVRALVSRLRRPERPPRAPDSDAGDTLLEVLIAVVILSITSVAMLAAFSTAIFGSATHRGLATMDTVLASAVQEATAALQQSASTGTSAFVCNSGYSETGNSQLFSLPANYTATITTIQYWNGATPTVTPQTTPSFAATPCRSYEPQMITIEVTDTAAGTTTTETTSTVVSDPSAPPPPAVGAAAALYFSTQPGNGVSGSALTTQPVVAILTAAGTVDTNPGIAPIALSITNASGVTVALNGCTSSGFYGAVTFSNCYVLPTGTYTMTASTTIGGTALTVTSPGTFTVGPDIPTQLNFTTSPSNGTAGAVLSTQPVVQLLDENGNPETGNTSSVTISVLSGPGSISCTSNTVALDPTTATATFAGCSISVTGTYQLTATITSLNLTSLNGSSTFTIAAGVPAYLVWSTQPTSTTGGAAFNMQPVLTLEDAAHNVVTGNTSSVTLAVTPNTGTAGASLSCSSNTVAVNSTSGTASFSGCSVNTAGSDYTLTATDASLTSASSTFNITVGPAHQLDVVTSPGNTTAGSTFSTQPVVDVEDAGGNLITSSTAPITLSVTGGGASVSCTANPVAAVGGVASFAGCKMTTAGTGYTLTATASGLASDSGSSFNITAGSAAQLNVTTSPGNTTGGANFATQPVVEVQDSYGNLITSSTAHITLAITSGSGTSGASLSCSTNPVTASGGIASFSGCSINTAGTGYNLTATSPGLASDNGNTFNITVGPAHQLDVTTSPGNTSGGTNFATQPVVHVEDAGGNLITSSTAHITLAVTSGTGTSGATLSCNTDPVTAAGGIATFSGCSINTAGTGYTLTASASGLASDTSNAFNITVGSASQLDVVTSPGNTTAGATFTPVVHVEDAGGNQVTSSTAHITLAITSGSGTSGASLSGCTTTVVASGGSASFTNCKITTTGTGYTLTATAPSLASDSGSSFNITPASATQIQFTAEPSGKPTHNTYYTVSVSVEDTYGNIVTSNNSTALTLSLSSGTGTLTCTGGKTQTTSSGVASFSCSISTSGSKTLSASGGGWNTSTTFSLT